MGSRALGHGTTVLLGLSGVAVRRVELEPDGSRVVHVVTAEETAAACPSCGVLSSSVKGNVVTRPKDLSYGRRCGWCGTSDGGGAGRPAAGGHRSPSSWRRCRPGRG